MLLFYRNESNQPLYTLDSRHTALLSNATFYYAEEPVQSSSGGNDSSDSSPNGALSGSPGGLSSGMSNEGSKSSRMASSKRGNRRYEFQLKSPISFMHIKQLNAGDAGIYRCRTDFRHSRTINRLVRLYITGEFVFILIISNLMSNIKVIAWVFSNFLESRNWPRIFGHSLVYDDMMTFGKIQIFIYGKQIAIKLKSLTTAGIRFWGFLINLIILRF